MLAVMTDKKDESVVLKLSEKPFDVKLKNYKLTATLYNSLILSLN